MLGDMRYELDKKLTFSRWGDTRETHKRRVSEWLILGQWHLSPLSKCPLSVHDEPKGEGTRWSRLGDYLGNTKGYERVGCPGKDS